MTSTGAPEADTIVRVADEVIANRAIQLVGGRLGSKDPCIPTTTQVG